MLETFRVLDCIFVYPAGPKKKKGGGGWEVALALQHSSNTCLSVTRFILGAYPWSVSIVGDVVSFLFLSCFSLLKTGDFYWNCFNSLVWFCALLEFRVIVVCAVVSRPKKRKKRFPVRIPWGQFARSGFFSGSFGFLLRVQRHAFPGNSLTSDSKLTRGVNASVNLS